MRVVVVDEGPPFPLDTGKKIRTFNLMKRLSRRHEITYICYGYGPVPPEVSGIRFVFLKKRLLEQRGAGFYLSLIRNLASYRPYVVERHYSAEMAETVRRHVKNGCDLMHCEWTPYTEAIREHLGSKPAVLSAHNVESQIWKRYLENEGSLLKREYIRVQYKKLLAYEVALCRKYDRVAAVSRLDKEHFQRQYACRNVDIVPNGVDETYFKPADEAIEPNSIVFTGSMDWRPNQDGIRFFLREIWPEIKNELRGAKFYIVGRRPPGWLVKIGAAGNDVIVTGGVEDVRPYIAKAGLYVVPLRIGGGSRLKILEALAMKKVVLSTTLGAEGLDLSNGVHLYLEDRPHEFARMAVHVLKSLGRHAHIAEKGCQAVLAGYTWDSIAELMDACWMKAVG
ncbi:MAG: glycosyltransferase family 4 protein [Nitrospiraceae bacterium]|nr:glycosyltransferase family 4 protein [Nitrospiraceae bacterium]